METGNTASLEVPLMRSATRSRSGKAGMNQRQRRAVSAFAMDCGTEPVVARALDLFLTREIEAGYLVPPAKSEPWSEARLLLRGALGQAVPKDRVELLLFNLGLFATPERVGAAEFEAITGLTPEQYLLAYSV